MIDILKLYQDYHINHKSQGHKHCRDGWVQIECPFCTGNPGFHLGYCIDPNSKFKGAFVCWRCGGKQPYFVLEKILNIAPSRAKAIIKQYQKRGSATQPEKFTKPKSSFKYPGGCHDLLPHHADYLKRRNFDPEYIRKKYGIFSTGPLAPLNKIDYKNRIIIPIHWYGDVVSYQGRDVTGKHKLKYMACPQQFELMEHKTILYGNAVNKRCVLVEGVTDVWRLGDGAVCTFGIKYRLEQVVLLAKMEEVFLFFDPESQAVKQANKIVAELRFRGVNAKPIFGILQAGSDPAEMEQDKADEFMKGLGF